MNDALVRRAISHGERSASEADAKQDRESVERIPESTASVSFEASGDDFGNGEHAGHGLGPEGDGRSCAQRGPDGLPCQNSNNSNKPGLKYRLRPIPGTEFLQASGDKRGVWRPLDEDTLQRFGFPTGAEAKSAFHLRLNVESFVNHWGRDHGLFFTVTDEQNLHPTFLPDGGTVFWFATGLGS